MMTWINFAMHVVRVFFFFFLSFNSSTSLIFALTRGDLWASNASVVSWLQIKHFAQGSSNKKSLGLLEHAVAFSLILHSKWLFKYSWSLPTIWPGSENKFKYLLKHFSLSSPSPFLVSSYKSPVWRRPIFVGEKKTEERWMLAERTGLSSRYPPVVWPYALQCRIFQLPPIACCCQKSVNQLWTFPCRLVQHIFIWCISQGVPSIQISIKEQKHEHSS